MEGTHPNAEKLRYLIGLYNVKGPDPNDHTEHNGFNTVVHNAVEDLYVYGLSFDKNSGRYVSEHLLPQS